MDETEQIWILLGLAGVTLVLAMVVGNLVRGRPGPIPLEGPLRLQVRPLRELRPDPAHLYLGNSISRDIVASLRNFERLEPALGETPANLVLDGTISKTGPRIVLEMRLLSGRHALWSATHDGAMNDLPRLQAEIASGVARRLNVAPRASAKAAQHAAR